MLNAFLVHLHRRKQTLKKGWADDRAFSTLSATWIWTIQLTVDDEQERPRTMILYSQSGSIYIIWRGLCLFTRSGSPEPKLRNELRVPTPLLYLLTADVWGLVGINIIIIMWLTILIIAIIIGGAFGFLTSKDGERGEGAFSGALAGGMGCGYILFQIFIAGVVLFIIISLFGLLFG